MKLSKKLGQHFLRDRNILGKEVKIAGVGGKIVLEIGPGDGRLTEEILRAGAKKVYAVEKDSRFAGHLREKFLAEDKIEIMEGGFLKIKVPDDIEVILGNIPYYISSKIIFALKNTKIKRAVFIVQKEFAEKMIAKAGQRNYGRLSVTSQLAFNVDLIQKVPKHLFAPPPKVDSAMILLKPKKTKLTEREENLIRILFQHKNKKIRNSLPDATPEWADKRPRELSPKEVLALVKDYSENSIAS